MKQICKNCINLSEEIHPLSISANDTTKKCYSIVEGGIYINNPNVFYCQLFTPIDNINKRGSGKE